MTPGENNELTCELFYDDCNGYEDPAQYTPFLSST